MRPKLFRPIAPLDQPLRLAEMPSQLGHTLAKGAFPFSIMRDNQTSQTSDRESVQKCNPHALRFIRDPDSCLSDEPTRFGAHRTTHDGHLPLQEFRREMRVRLYRARQIPEELTPWFLSQTVTIRAPSVYRQPLSQLPL